MSVAILSCVDLHICWSSIKLTEDLFLNGKRTFDKMMRTVGDCLRVKVQLLSELCWQEEITPSPHSIGRKNSSRRT